MMLKNINLWILVTVAITTTACDSNEKQAQEQALSQKIVDSLVTIEGGRYQMGDFGHLIGEKLSITGEPDTRPLHWVELSDFRITKYRITWDEFNAWLVFLGRKKNDFYQRTIKAGEIIKNYEQVKYLEEEYPASASWQDALNFCRWVGERTGRNLSLPTEAQWEYAARNRGQFVIFANSDNHYVYPAKEKNYAQKKEPVGSYPPNPLGLYDMMGNGREWMMDWYQEDYYSHSPTQNPQGPESGKLRVLRGYAGEMSGTTTVYRLGQMPDRDGPSYGFRCVENIPLK